MISNLQDVIQNIKDLLELKKEKLRVIWENESILKLEIVELEFALAKLETKSLVINEEKEVPIKESIIENKKNRIKSNDILTFIMTYGPVSRREIQKHFNCGMLYLDSCLTYLLDCNRIKLADTNDAGMQVFVATEQTITT